MKTGTLNSTTFRLSVMSLFVLLVSFGTETAAKRGCKFYGHACWGGHGKRSTFNMENPSIGADPEIMKDGSWSTCNGILQSYRQCMNRANRLPRNARTQPNYVSQLFGGMTSYNRRPYDTAHSETNGK